MNGYSEDFRQHLLREAEEFLSRHLNGGGHGTKATAASPVLPGRARDTAVCWPTDRIGGMHLCRTWITLNSGEPSALLITIAATKMRRDWPHTDPGNPSEIRRDGGGRAGPKR